MTWFECFIYPYCPLLTCLEWTVVSAYKPHQKSCPVLITSATPLLKSHQKHICVWQPHFGHQDGGPEMLEWTLGHLGNPMGHTLVRSRRPSARDEDCYLRISANMVGLWHLEDLQAQVVTVAKYYSLKTAICVIRWKLWIEWVSKWVSECVSEGVSE